MGEWAVITEFRQGGGNDRPSSYPRINIQPQSRCEPSMEVTTFLPTMIVAGFSSCVAGELRNKNDNRLREMRIFKTSLQLHFCKLGIYINKT